LAAANATSCPAAPQEECFNRLRVDHADLNAPPAPYGLHRCICASGTKPQLGGRKDSQWLSYGLGAPAEGNGPAIWPTGPPT